MVLGCRILLTCSCPIPCPQPAIGAAQGPLSKEHEERVSQEPRAAEGGIAVPVPADAWGVRRRGVSLRDGGLLCVPRQWEGQCFALSHGQVSLPGEGHSPELPVTHPPPAGSCAGVGGGRAPRAAGEQPVLPSHRVPPGRHVQLCPGRYGAPQPAALSWGPGCNPLPTRIPAEGGGKCCPGPQAVGASRASTASLRRGPAPGRCHSPMAVSPLAATALARRAVSPGLVISGLIRDMMICSFSSSIPTTLRHPGLSPHQQHRLHGGGGAGRAAAGAAQARPLAGLLQPAGTRGAASGGPVPGPAASPRTRRRLCSAGEALPRRAQPGRLPHAVCAGRRGCCCLSSGGTFISKRWRLRHLSPAVGCRAVGKGCSLCPGLAGRLTAPGRWEVASSGLPQPKFLCPQDPVLQVLLSADLEGFQHFPSQEEAGEALGCPGCFPGAGVPRLLLRGALEDEPGSLTFVRPQSCRVGAAGA